MEATQTAAACKRGLAPVELDCSYRGEKEELHWNLEVGRKGLPKVGHLPGCSVLRGGQ